MAGESVLDQYATAFQGDLSRFGGFQRLSFSVGELLANPKWQWGYERGVYCFLVGEKVVYVGRALGATLGERVWSQMHSLGDPAWAAVATDTSTQVEIFSVPSETAFIASALEAYLIERLRPEFNLRRQ